MKKFTIFAISYFLILFCGHIMACSIPDDYVCETGTSFNTLTCSCEPVVVQGEINISFPTIVYDNSGKYIIIKDGSVISKGNKLKFPSEKIDWLSAESIREGNRIVNNKKDIVLPEPPPPLPKPTCVGPFCPGGSTIFSIPTVNYEDVILRYRPTNQLNIYQVEPGAIRWEQW